MSSTRTTENISELALKKSEDFNDPSATWHISRQQMAKTSLALSLVIKATETFQTLKTSSNKFIAVNHYKSKGDWIKNAFEIQLKMSAEHSEKLAILIERSMLRAAGYSEVDWQEYYEYSRNKIKADKSWAISANEMNEIITFLKSEIEINTDYFVPYYAGLSDDKKTIYFDHQIKKIIPTPVGNISPIDFVVLHERVEGAMMEQSYLEQLQKGRSKIQFECPIALNDNNQFFKVVMTYQLVANELKLSYEILPSSKDENDAIPGMDQQAVSQNVLSYEFGHQIAERLERAAIYASGYGEIWEAYYNAQVMDDINKLIEQYTVIYNNGSNFTHPSPFDLYIVPYAQCTDEPIETNLLRLVIEPKLQNILTNQAKPFPFNKNSFMPKITLASNTSYDLVCDSSLKRVELIERNNSNVPLMIANFLYDSSDGATILSNFQDKTSEKNLGLARVIADMVSEFLSGNKDRCKLFCYAGIYENEFVDCKDYRTVDIDRLMLREESKLLSNENIIEPVINIYRLDAASISAESITQMTELLKNHTYWAREVDEDYTRQAVNNSECIVATDPQGKIIGFVRFISNHHIAYISDMVVDAAWRRKQLGTALMQKACELIDAEKHEFSALISAKEGDGYIAAPRLYGNKFGFTDYSNEHQHNILFRYIRLNPENTKSQKNIISINSTTSLFGKNNSSFNAGLPIKKFTP